jgi:hypothetical protein
MRKLLLLTIALTALAMPAMAADMAAKANPPSPLFTGYPYGSSGVIFGLYTEGGGGPVNGAAAVPGGAVNPNGLVELNAAFGATVGYAWGAKNSPFAYSVEADVGGTNFNGSQQGFSIGGPLEGEFRVVAYTPAANLTQWLPNAPNLGTPPPFNVLPAGVTASNIQVGLMGGVHWNDVSLNFQGLSSNKEFRAAPMFGIVQMEQLSNGVALRTYIKDVVSQQSITVGPIPTKVASGGLTNQVLAGFSVLW